MAFSFSQILDYFMLAIQKSNDATILTLCEKCPHSVRIQEIRTRNNSVFGHFSRSVVLPDSIIAKS